MTSIINTNINSLNAQRNLGLNQASLSNSMQRLSSGLRINSAKDDAAGLAISDRMTSQIRGLSQASRNANDGISLSQTAEGALGEVTSNLQRIRELAVQSANSTNTASDRASLDQEVQQRIAEIDRVTSQTSFNGQKLLDGSFGTATFQVGADVGQTISIDLSNSMRNTNLGKTADYAGGAAFVSSAGALGQQGTGVVAATAFTGAAGFLSLSVGTGQAVNIGASVAGTITNAAALGQTAGSAFAKAAAINAAGVGGLTATADTTVVMAYTATSTAGFALTIGGVSVQAATTGPLTGAALASAINTNSAQTGVTATFSGGNMTLNAVDGRNIILGQTATATEGFQLAAGTNNTVNTALDGTAGTATLTAVGTLRLQAAGTITAAGTGVANAGLAAQAYALGTNALNTTTVTTVANANAAITTVDAAMTNVSTLRGTFGAIQNRFDSVIANLSSSVENLSASRSRIQDADFATETANLSRSQILQQAGTAMVAQANQLPQGVLALLR
jgi:flagellin